MKHDGIPETKRARAKKAPSKPPFRAKLERYIVGFLPIRNGIWHRILFSQVPATKNERTNSTRLLSNECKCKSGQKSVGQKSVGQKSVGQKSVGVMDIFFGERLGAAWIPAVPRWALRVGCLLDVRLG